MTKNELNLRLNEIRDAARKQELASIKEYGLAKNIVKLGDVVTDHYHTIRVESISVSGNLFSGDYYCVCRGVELTKAGKPKVKSPDNHCCEINLEFINGVPYSKPKGD